MSINLKIGFTDQQRYPHILTDPLLPNWFAGNLDHYSDAEATRGVSERVRDDAVRLVGWVSLLEAVN